MISIPELIIGAGVIFVLLAVLILILVIRMHGRRREREQNWRQLDSVHNNRDRRKRGN